MKKNCIVFSLLTILALVFLTTCEVGLGEAVDTAAPTISITYPPTSSVIRDSFIVAGTCDDDKAVESVALTISSKGTDVSETYTYPVVLSQDKKSWTAEINKKEAGSKYNGWQLSDGTYEVSVYSQDGVGRRSGTTSRAFVIDNTAPLFVLSGPNSTTKEKIYGSSFDVDGTIAESNEVKSLSVKIFDQNGNVVSKDSYSSEPETVSDYYTHQNVSTKGGSSECFLKYTENGTTKLNAHYVDVYGNNAKAGTKHFKCEISITDNAKEYKNPGESENKSTGNNTRAVYLNDDIYDSLMSADGEGLSATDLMQVYNGTTGRKNRDDLLAKLNTFRTDTAEKNLLFTLNPAVSPCYSVNGYDWTETAVPPNASKKQNVTIVTSAGIDGTLLKPATYKAYIKDFGSIQPDASAVALFMENPSKAASVVEFAGNSGYEGSTVANYNWDIELPEDITSGHYYFIGVTGEDADGVKLVASGNYGFKGALSGTPPSVKFDSASPAVSKTTEGWTWSGEATSSERTINIAGVEASVTVVDVSSGTVFAEKMTGNWTPFAENGVHYDSTNKKWSFNMNELAGYNEVTSAREGSGKIYTYQVSVTARDSNGSTTQSKSATIDALGPQVRITSVSPVVEQEGTKYVNGTINISAAITESNLSAVKYSVYLGDSPTPAKGPIDLGKISIVTIPVETQKLADADGKPIRVVIEAYDTVGNKGTADTSTYNNNASYVIKQVTDQPQISLSNAHADIDNKSDGKKITVVNNLFGVNTNNKLTGSVTDDDGIKKISITVYKSNNDRTEADLNSVAKQYDIPFAAGSEPTSYTFNCELPKDEGVYFVKISAEDKKGETSYATNSIGNFAIAVDSGAPVISITSPSISQVQFVASEFTVSGTINKPGECTVTGAFKTDNTGTSDINVTGSSIGPVSSATASWNSAINMAGNEGTFYLFYTAEDKWGQTASAKVSFKVDNTPPTFNITKYGTVTPDSPITKDSSDITAYADINSTYIISGKYDDGTNGSGVKAVYYYIGDTEPAKDNGHYNVKTAGWISEGTLVANGEWTVYIYNDRLKTELTGQKRIYIAMEDCAGNVSVAADNPGGKIVLNPDKDAPSLEITKPGAGTNTNTTIVLEGTASDDNNLDENAAVTVSVTKDGSEVVKTVITRNKLTDNKWTVSYTVGAGNTLASDGTYKFTVTAKDVAGRTRVMERSVVLDTNKPAPGTPVFASSVVKHAENAYVSLSATATDNGGTGVANMYYAIGDTAPAYGTDADIAANWKSMTLNGNSWSATADFTSVTEDSVKKCWTLAQDRAGNRKVSDSAVSVTVDMYQPVIEITGSATAKESDITLTVKVKDTNPKKPTVKVQRAGGETYTLPSDSFVGNGNRVENTDNQRETYTEYTVTIPFGKDGDGSDSGSKLYTDGDYTVTVSEEDVNGWAALDKTHLIFKDSANPVVEINSLAKQYVNVGSVSFSGTITEAKLVKTSVKATLTGTDVDGPVNKELVVSLGDKDESTNKYIWNASAADLKDGIYKLTVTAKDESEGEGTASTADDALVVDTIKPSSTFSGESILDNKGSEHKTFNSEDFDKNGNAEERFYSKADSIVLKGTITETNFAAATVSVNGGGAATLASGSGDWTYTVNVGGEAAKDKEYEFVFNFTDKAGNKQVNKFTVVRDKTPPILTLNNLSSDQNVGLNAEKEKAYTITGLAPDELAGLEKINYSLVKGTNPDSTPLFSRELTSENKFGSLTGASFMLLPLGDDGGYKPIDFSDKEKGFGQGDYILKISATDKIGNTSDELSVAFYNDEAAPVVNEITAYKTGDVEKKKISMTKDAFVLTGTVTETNALLPVDKSSNKYPVVVKDSDTNFEWIPTVTGAGTSENPYTWTLTLTPGGENSSDVDAGIGNIKDGQHTFIVTAKDIKEREHTNTYILTSDTKAPVWNMPTDKYTQDAPYIATSFVENNTKKWYKNEALLLALKAKDETSGIDSIKYVVNYKNDADTPYIDGANANFSIGVTDGRNIIRVKAIDRVGNTIEKNDIYAYVDTKPVNKPVVDLIEAVKDSNAENLGIRDSVLVNGTKDIRITISVTDDTSSVTDDTSVEDCSSGVAGVWITKIGSKTINPMIAATRGEGDNKDKWTLTIPAETIKALDNAGALNINVKDVAGNSADFSSLLTLTLDKTAPVVVIRTPANKEGDALKSINGRQAVTGTTTESNPLSVTLYYTTKTDVPSSITADGWKQYGFITTAAKPKDESEDPAKIYGATTAQVLDWSFDVNFNELAGLNDTISNGSFYLLAVAEDTAGNKSVSETITSAQCTQFNVDLKTDVPTIKVNAITGFDGMTAKEGETAWLKNSTSLTGTIIDDDGISKLEYSTDGETYKGVSSFSGGSWRIDDLKEGTNTLYFKATDNQGGVWTSAASPTLKYTGGHAEGSLFITDGSYTKGTAEDGLTILYLAVDKTPPQVREKSFSKNDRTNNDGESGTYGASLTDLGTVGGKFDKFKVNLYAYDQNGIEGVKLTGKVKVLKTVGGKATEIEQSLGKDGKGIDFTASTGTKEIDGNTYTLWTSDDITVNTLEAGSYKDYKDDTLISGSYTVTITVTDKAGSTNISTLTFKVDNDAPVISPRSPSSTTSVKGDVTVYGNVDASTLYYAVSTSGEVAPGGDVTTYEYVDMTGEPPTIQNIPNIKDKPEYKYKNVTNASLSWFLYFDSGEQDDYGHTYTFRDYITKYGIATEDELKAEKDPFNKIVKFYLWLKAVDEVGNTSEIAYPILYDPQGDRPVVSITSPKADEVVGGTIRMYGTASDNSGVTAVFAQFVSGYTGGDIQPTKDFWNELDKKKIYTICKMQGYDANNEVPWTTGAENPEDYGILIKPTGSSWSLAINKSKEFEAGTQNTVAARLYSYDGTYLSLPQNVVFTIDAYAPTIGDAWLECKDNEKTISIPYSDGMFLKSKSGTEDLQWKLKVVLSDNEKVEHVNVGMSTLDSASAKTEKKDVLATYCKPTDNNQTVTLTYPLDTLTVGTAYVYIECQDSNGANGQAVKSYTINFDGKKPVLAGVEDSAYRLNPTVSQSDGFFNMSSKVSESDKDGKQSGFERVAFYFIRRDTKSDKKPSYIIDPMIKKNADGNRITINTSEDPLNKMCYEDGLYWKKQNVTRDADNHNVFTLSEANPNIHPGGLVKINGSIYRISKGGMDNLKGAKDTKVTLDAIPPADYEEAMFAYANVVDQSLTETPKGNGSFKTDYLYGYDEPGGDDGDYMVEGVTNAGTDWTWEANIYSKNIPDGPIEMHYVAFDKAGNWSKGIVAHASKTDYTSKKEPFNTQDAKAGDYTVYAFAQNADSAFYKEKAVPASVSNNAPRLANISIGTDINGDNKVDVSEMTVKYTEKSLTWDNAKTIMSGDNLGSKDKPALTAKGRTVIKPEILGGNGNIYYSYTIEGVEETYTIKGENDTALLAGDGNETDARSKEINIQVGDFLHLKRENSTEEGISNGKTKFTFEFWDETEISEKFVDSQKATAEIYMNVAIRDTTLPESNISPLYWKSKTDNSLYKNSTANGHIDLPKEKEGGIFKKVGAEYTDNRKGAYDTYPAAEMDLDPKVSGKITLKGSVSDDKLLSSIYISVTNKNGKDVMLGSAGMKKKDSTTAYYLAAEYNRDTKIWTDTSKEDKGIVFTAKNTKFDQTGHEVEWTFDWDTSKITGVAMADVVIKVCAYDENATSEKSTTTTTYLGLDGKTYWEAPTYADANSGEGSYQVDVVPYITGVTTSLSAISNSGESVVYDQDMFDKASVYNRTALGHYPVYFYKNTGDSTNKGETYTVSGFNFENGATSCTETVTAASKSGYYRKAVKGVYSLNNLNDNENTANKLPNGMNNDGLTDDVYIDVWQFNNKAVVSDSQKIEMVTMKINPANDMVGFAFRYGESGKYFAMPNGMTNSWAQRDKANDIQNSITFSYDAKGNSYGTVAGGESGNAGGYYTDYFSVYKNNGNRCRIEITGQTGTKTQENYSVGDEVKTSEKNKHLSATIATAGDNYYLAYFDDFNKELRFRNKANIGDYKTGNDPHKATTVYRYEHEHVNIVAQANSPVAKPGNYVSIAAIPKSDTMTDDAVVIVWYDSTNNCMWYSYTNAPNDKNMAGSINSQETAFSSSKDTFEKVTAAYSATEKYFKKDKGGYIEATPTDKHIKDWNNERKNYYTRKVDTVSAGWSIPEKIFDTGVGSFCRVVVDKEKNVHIAAYDSSGNDLQYAYLSDYTKPDKKTTCIVDSDGAVGNNLTLDVAYDKRNNKEVAVPYIGYSSSERPKLAFYAGDNSNPAEEAGAAGEDKFTGKWEVAYVPTVTTFKPVRINVGVWKGTDGILKNSKSTASTTSAVYGNDSNNAILGYSYESLSDSGGYIETAQRVADKTN